MIDENEDVAIGFRAMAIFLFDYWKRGGQLSDDVAALLGSLDRNDDGFPMDIALWDDWLRAYEEAQTDLKSSR